MRIYTIIGILLLSNGLFAQYYNDVINTNRPGFAISAYNVGNKAFQIESGVSMTTYNWSVDQKSFNNSLDLSLRYGLNEKFEFYSNLSPNNTYNSYSLDYTDVNGVVIGSKPMVDNAFAFSPITLGAAYRFNENNGIVPAFAVNGGIMYWEGSKGYIDAEFVLTTQNQLSSNWIFISNWRLNQIFNQANFNFVLALTGSLSSKWVWFVENVGDKNLAVSGSDYIGRLHTGFGYLLNKNLQLDIFGGALSNLNDKPGYYISVGVSWRLEGIKYNSPVGAENIQVK